MAYVALYDETGDERARQVQAGVKRTLGMLPQTYQAMGRSGKFLESAMSLDHAAGANLDERTRQLVAVAVSAANGCGYCVHAHRALALKAGCDDEQVTGAIEIASMMSAFNTFNKAIGLVHDVTPQALGVGVD